LATITLTIPNDKIDRIVTAFCGEFGYQDTITNEDGTTSTNPVSKNAFTKQKVVEYVKQVTRNYEANISAAQARVIVDSDVNSINIT